VVRVAGVDGLDVEALYAGQWRAMVRLAVLLVDDVGSAEDVVQDAFIALQRNGSSVRDSAAATAYLRVAVVNGARSLLRKRRTARRYLASAEPAPPVEAADSAVLVAAGNAELMEAVRRLPRRQREVLVLRYWSHLSEAEIARTLNISPGTVKSSASRGLDALEAMLEGVR
jgi:RNA polymerase sigma-70 factor (sigma-E family)